ncbi:MAG: ATPase domain-containing protein [Gemmataceae bacterium]
MTIHAAPNLQHVGTGIEGLDHILRGGLTPNRLYLVEGDPGSGKTTLAMQFLREGARLGEPCLFVTLSESEEELQASAASHGWSLDHIQIVEIIPSEDSLRPDARYTMFHPSEVELGETVKAVLAEAERSQPARLVFDSMSELRLLAQNPLRYRRQILALKHFFTRQRCTVLFIDDKTGDVGDTHLHSIAHGVISMERHSPDYGMARRRLQVIKMRGSDFRTGFHDFAIRQGGIEVFPRLVAAEFKTRYQREAVPSGLEALDTLLGGGLARGTSTLLLGPAGSGKSSVATQYAVAAAQRGEHVALFLFDEGIDTLFERSAALGMDVEGLARSGRLSLRQIDPAELSTGEFAHAVRQTIDRNGTRLVMIDSLNGYLHAMPSERHLTLHLHELLTYLGQQGTTTLLLMAQHGLIRGNAQGPVDTSYLADTVILMRYFEAFGAVRQAISVIKKRTGRHERNIRELRFEGKKGIIIGEPVQEFHGILSGSPMIVGNHQGGAGEST